MRIVLLVPWIGPLPPWYDLFMERMEANKPLVEVKVLHNPSPHIRQWLLWKDTFPPGIISARKLCDYRPAFGDIFADEVSHADFCGWCDMDVVFGDMGHFLTPHLDSYDVITDSPAIINGPFTIMRNRPAITHLLYRTGGDFRRVFANHRHVAWDEGGFTDIVKASGVPALFMDGVHTHDNESPAPWMVGDKLFSGGREIMSYHFPRTKQWPL